MWKQSQKDYFLCFGILEIEIHRLQMVWKRRWLQVRSTRGSWHLSAPTNYYSMRTELGPNYRGTRHSSVPGVRHTEGEWGEGEAVAGLATHSSQGEPSSKWQYAWTTKPLALTWAWRQKRPLLHSCLPNLPRKDFFSHPKHKHAENYGKYSSIDTFKGYIVIKLKM